VITALINYEQSYLEEQCQRFSQVDKPVLILWGRQDEVISYFHLKNSPFLIGIIGLRG